MHQLQQRMQAGRLNRAHRGEWLGQPPPGYVSGPDGKLQFDPDEQAQQVIRLILDQFALPGSASGVLRYLTQQHLQLPFRPISGPHQGQLRWHPPQRETLRSLLHRPAYAGVYTWGRSAIDPRRAVPGQRSSGRVQREPQDCAVFLPDNHPAYLSWEQYQSNRQRLRQQRQRGPRPGRQRTTVALLAGVVGCGVCGSRLLTRYTRTLRYDCQRHALDRAGPACQSFVGAPLEQLVSAQILEVSLRAAADWERQRAALDHHWRLRLERARQDSERAFRQDNAVEPENRLVARTLERQWEEALGSQRSMEEQYHRFQQTQPTLLSAAERAAMERLANDLPAWWQSPQTSLTDKRQVVRLLLQQVVVWAPASSHEVKVALHWTGGSVTEHVVRRPVQKWNQMADIADIRACLRHGHAAGWTARRIAEALNEAGHRTPHGRLFTPESVRQLWSREQRAPEPARPRRRKQRP